MSRLGSTWIGSCLASCVGSLYTALILTLEAKDSELAMVFASSLAIGIIISLPLLFIGSVVMGQFLSHFLETRYRFNRPLLFSLLGLFLGIVCFLILCRIISINPFEHFKVTDVNGLLNAMKLPSIFMVYLGVAGLITALHINHGEQLVAPNR